MCDTCGCNLTPGNKHLAFKPVAKGATAVSVLKGLLAKNDDQAAHNREHFDRRGILAINLMSSPGSGKTALLEATLVALKDEFTCAVIEGDLETENDAERIRAKGVQAHQIVTGTACHLDAHLVHDALHHMSLDGVDLLFIENVGNLVCPASFDLGEAHKVAILSVTEGEDKPLKYPDMFAAADLMLLNKSDLLPHLDFDVDLAIEYARRVNPDIRAILLSARTGEGMAEWYDWLDAQMASVAPGGAEKAEAALYD
jgi:hydrogenase nickel incorporation protein HypB